MRAFLDEWLFFELSNKLKFAIKVSLSLMLAYIIPIAMGWSQPNIAAITVMFIASSSTLKESINMGVVRIIATIIGAIIGLTLVALFPQERFIYLLSLSIIMLIISYMYYSYQGDKTLFMLSGVMIMMIYLNGPQEAFIYGIDRTYMTVFGILVYTLIGTFIWSESTSSDTQKVNKIKFIWFDIEDIKATFQLFLLFWFSVIFWIYVNPPGGFLIVLFAMVIGLLTTFSPIKPLLLIVLFSIGFIFATLMYIFVLPNLVYGWELGLFLFFYTFIAFYFIPAKLSLFFLIGLFLLGIDNTMNYNFALFLTILLTFYTFLVIVMLFYNFPFSSKPEHLFTILKDRFFKHAKAIELQNLQSNSWLEEKKLNYHKTHLQICSKKLTLWGSKIDTSYFENVNKEQISNFTKECENYITCKDSILKCYNSAEQIDWHNLKESRF